MRDLRLGAYILFSVLKSTHDDVNVDNDEDVYDYDDDDYDDDEAEHAML